MRNLTLLGSLVLIAALAPNPAKAGIPECGNIRLESVANCDVRLSAECTAGCERLGIYKVACATRLENVCRPSCTFSAEAGCTDSCTVSCSADCDAGINVICQHNCFGECVGACDATCASAEDPTTCRASCEATCDGECDIQCSAVDGDCYTHCVECCGGSCTAQANMDCQVECQDVEFEDCEHEFQADCSASCSVDGALFCDDQYIISGSMVPGCIEALLEQGIEVEAEGTVTLGPDGVSTGCSASPGRSNLPLAGAFFVLVGLAGARRRLRA